MPRNVTREPVDPRERFGLYRLCECPECEGRGKEALVHYEDLAEEGLPRRRKIGTFEHKCPECRGEGRVRQELAGCDSPEAVGVALVTLAREGQWEGCAFGLLDRMPECETCGGRGAVEIQWLDPVGRECPGCKGSGVKPTGTWLILPWLPSARNVTDAARTLARSKGARTSG